MYTLRELIRASGYAGVAGQSFRNNVAGAGPGAKMSDYKCNGWSFASEPAPEIFYSEGQGFTISVDFSQGSRASYIKRLGNAIVINPGIAPFGFDVYNKSSNVVGAASGSSVSFNVHAPYASGVLFDGGAWYTGFTSPAKPGDSSTADVTFTGKVFAESPSGTDAVSVVISYAPDIGPFNPTLTKTFSFTMNRRAASTNLEDYDWEWYTPSNFATYGYDGVHYMATTSGIVIPSNPQETHTYYLRARDHRGGSWVNIGAIEFYDDRPLT